MLRQYGFTRVLGTTSPLVNTEVIRRKLPYSPWYKNSVRSHRHAALGNSPEIFWRTTFLKQIACISCPRNDLVAQWATSRRTPRAVPR